MSCKHCNPKHKKTLEISQFMVILSTVSVLVVWLSQVVLTIMGLPTLAVEAKVVMSTFGGANLFGYYCQNTVRAYCINKYGLGKTQNYDRDGGA